MLLAIAAAAAAAAATAAADFLFDCLLIFRCLFWFAVKKSIKDISVSYITYALTITIPPPSLLAVGAPGSSSAPIIGNIKTITRMPMIYCT